MANRHKDPHILGGLTRVLQPQTQTAAYWTTDFKLSRADIEFVFSRFLEDEQPQTTRALVLALIERRLQAESDRLRKQLARGEIFRPKNAYAVGQEVIFPAFGFASGKVTALRDGHNPEYGPFTVMSVEFEGGKTRELACNLQVPHALNAENADGSPLLAVTQPTPEEIYAQYGEALAEELEARLVDEKDAVFMGGRWFVKTLVADVGIGDLNLAEAVLDMSDGGPRTTSEILAELDFAKDLKPALREFSLEVALAADDRFDNVGAAGEVVWFLRRLEPDEVRETPPRLEYQPINFDPNLLPPDLLSLIAEIGDEHSALPMPETRPDHVTITLIYPHRRVGTLPMNAALEAMLPPAGDSPRQLIRFTDNQTGEIFSAWLNRDGRYLCGFSDFYRRHRLPIGAYITVKATAKPSHFEIDYKGHRPRTEYIRLAIPNAGRLRFENFKRSIGAVYDEQMILGAEDIDGVDDVWAQTRQRRRTLSDIVGDLLPELARLNPQRTVHAKTLYSAVNIVRRCPPGPIFATLMARPEFQAVGGSYWRIAEERP